MWPRNRAREKATLVVNGELRHPWYDDIATPAFGPDSEHTVYWAKKLLVWSIVVDGHEDGNLFIGAVKGARFVFDGPDRFHTLALIDANQTVARVDVTIKEDQVSAGESGAGPGKGTEKDKKPGTAMAIGKP